MRWLIAHPGVEYSVADVCTGWAEGLTEAGEQVRTFALNDWLTAFDNAYVRTDDGIPGDPAPEGATFRKTYTAEQATELAADQLAGALFKAKPDVLLVVTGFFLDVEMLDFARKAYGTKIVALHTEQPYELDRELEFARHADLNLINDPLHKAAFQEIGPTVYAPHAYRPSVHRPGPGREDLAGTDLCFAGSGFSSRVWFFEKMAKAGALPGRNVVLAGNWMPAADSPLRDWCTASRIPWDNPDVADLYRSAKAGLNLYRREANEGQTAAGVAISPREVEMAACGLFFARDPRQEGDDVWPMLPTFAGPDQAAEVLDWWLRHDSHREEAARQAREAITGRTFANHARELLRLFDRQPITFS